MALYELLESILPPSLGLWKTFISTVSKICPGTCSSGPLDVVGVTNPSPSTTISSGLIPFAVVNCKSPPLNKVS